MQISTKCCTWPHPYGSQNINISIFKLKIQFFSHSTTKYPHIQAYMSCMPAFVYVFAFEIAIKYEKGIKFCVFLALTLFVAIFYFPVLDLSLHLFTFLSLFIQFSFICSLYFQYDLIHNKHPENKFYLMKNAIANKWKWQAGRHDWYFYYSIIEKCSKKWIKKFKDGSLLLFLYGLLSSYYLYSSDMNESSEWQNLPFYLPAKCDWVKNDEQHQI